MILRTPESPAFIAVSIYNHEHCLTDRLQLQRPLAVLSALFASLTYAVSPLKVEGSDYVNSVNGERFQIIGVAYQPGGSSGYTGGSDPLSDPASCLRDATMMQRLGVNTIRVYNLDPDVNHNQCASIFDAAGIYMILDVNSPLPNQSLNRGAPWTSYDSDYLNRTFAVVEAFKSFPNTLGFFSGNEVINQQSVSQVPSYIRAVTRDLKDYIAKNVDRAIPVGYSAADVSELLVPTWEYLSCSLPNSTSSQIDFFGLNDYSWCGDSSFTVSGYDTLITMFSNTTIPVFFSEYGCNTVSPRAFTEVPVLYGPQMTGVMSGGLIYEYSQGSNNYGLVSINDNGTISLLQDYNNLAAQYATLNIKELETGNSTATSLTAPTCDASLVGDSGFDDGFDIPAAPSGVADMIANGISPKPTGSLVAVTSTAVPQMVYNVSGAAISGLSLVVLPSDDSNTPGSNDSGTGGSAGSGSGTSTATSSSTSASSTAKSAGVKSGVNLGQLVLATLTLVIFMRL